MGKFDVGVLPPILQAEFDRYSQKHRKSNKCPTAFEAFSLELYLAQVGIKAAKHEDVLTGGRGDTFIDAVLFMANGNLISSKTDFIALNGEEISDLHIHLVQVTSSRNPPIEKFDNFMRGCCNFFAPKSAIPENDRMLSMRTLKDFIEETMINREGAFVPSITLTYIWPGIASNTLISHTKRCERRLKTEYPDFDVYVKLIFQNDLESIISSAEMANEGYLSAENFIQAPAIDGIEGTFIGFAHVQDIVRLTSKVGCKLLSPDFSVFYDNVRSFLGWTDTNKNIRNTIQNPLERTEFILRNNGIVLSASDFNIEENKLLLKNYQVINGCQTCCILVENSNDIRSDFYVPVKVIVSKDPDILDKAIEAANRHNQIGELDLLSRHRYAKNLEQYFNSISIVPKIWLERRSHQYTSERGESRSPNQIVDLKSLLLAASVLRRPAHQVQCDGNRKIRQCVSAEELFSSTDNYGVYHCVSMVIFHLRDLMTLESWNKYGAKYHVYLTVFKLIESELDVVFNLRMQDFDVSRIRRFLSNKESRTTVQLGHKIVETSFRNFCSNSTIRTRSEASSHKQFTECVNRHLRQAISGS